MNGLQPSVLQAAADSTVEARSRWEHAVARRFLLLPSMRASVDMDRERLEGSPKEASTKI